VTKPQILHPAQPLAIPLMELTPVVPDCTGMGLLASLTEMLNAGSPHGNFPLPDISVRPRGQK